MSVTPISPDRLRRGTAAGRGAPDAVRVRSFILVVSTTAQKLPPRSFGSNTSPHTIASANERWELSFVPESPHQPDAALDRPSSITLLLGDDAEWTDVAQHECMGNASAVRCDFTQGSVQVLSSITGLPPIFLCRRPDRVIVTSDLSLLATSAQPFRFDPATVVDLFQIGYPTGHRSLFRDTSLVPGGHTLRIDGDGHVNSARTWSLPDTAPRLDWPSYIDFQVQTFRAAIRKMDVSSSFLSLTGGVDTRTILAALISEGVSLPTATLTGPTLSLDARVAQTLSRAYSLPHHVVRLDGDFLRNLPTYVVAASRRSGGLTSLEEAGEVYFYRQLAGVGARRLSGLFGNQVGRQGFERLSPRGADLSILAEEFIGAGTRTPPGTDLIPDATRWHSAYERWLQAEGTLPSVANFCIGQHFATQQSPYASRAMIESLGRSPLGVESVGAFSVSRARRRDLRHRVLGEPTDRSFQRGLIARVGGEVASCSLNWGWRPSGGVSPRGLVMGAVACLDQIASWPNPVSQGLGKILRLIGAEGFQEIKPYRRWLTDWLKDFVHDTLLSQTTLQSGLFNATELTRRLRQHYVAGESQCATIMAALDLALAHQLFGTDPAAGVP
jgi:hypothetical protein